MVAADASRVAYGWRVFEDLLGGIYLGLVLECRRDIGICV
jgi:hypothetical protein